MRNPLTAAIPAVLVALAACSGDGITGPSSTARPGSPGTPGGSGVTTGSTGTTSTTTSTTTSGTNTSTSKTVGATSTSTTSESSAVTTGSVGSVAGGTGSLGAGGTGSFAGGTGSFGGGSGSSNGSGGVGESGGGVSASVNILGSFEVVVPGTDVVVGYRTSPQPAAAGGSCGLDDQGQPNGTWTKTTYGTTSTHLLHQHCTIRETTPARTILVSIADVATYVQSPNGNIALNLPSSCAAGISDASCADRFVHYRANGDATNGAGLLTGTDDDGNVWTIDLSQIAHDGSSRQAHLDGISPAYRAYSALVATSSNGLTSSAARFAW